jgi:hypothetical protein
LAEIKRSSGSNIVQELERISVLRKDGVISDSEFEQAKAKILAS